MSGDLPLLLLYALMEWTGITLTLLPRQELTQLLNDISLTKCTLSLMRTLHILPATLSRF